MLRRCPYGSCMRKILTLSHVVAACSLGVLGVACGSDDSTSDAETSDSSASTGSAVASATTDGVATTLAPVATEAPAPDVEVPTIVVTTNILGDIVTQAVGELAEVEVIMGVGSDPHDFAPSARQAESMENADLLVANGAGFEEGMIDIIELVEASGTPVFEFADHIDLIEFDGDHDHGDDDHDHGDDDHDHGDEDHDHGDEITTTATRTTATRTTATRITATRTMITTTPVATRTSGPIPHA
jgi:zinc/manganese transport system substrate-binding protein